MPARPLRAVFVVWIFAAAAATAVGRGHPDAETRPADPAAALDGRIVAELAVSQELRRREHKDLEFACGKDWEDLLAADFRKELLEAKIGPSAGSKRVGGEAGGEGERPPGTARALLVLTRADRSSHDYSDMESRDSYVSVSFAARVELSLPGEDVPRTTDTLEASAEAKGSGALTSDLFRKAFLQGFEEIAFRAAEQVRRHLRPADYEKEKDEFAPFRRIIR